ncbi:DUF5958 family protein [Streptomyces sp. NPDC004728]|uniref:DUF5958 family protein n=1 Tax=Streptomyces sp. NPDC004728 TaxID=3154289 RepID=UPI00339DE1B2
MSQGIAWFDALDPEEQSDALLFLRHHCVQARAVAEDGPEGIRRAGLRPTHTPAVLITRGRINDQLGKIASLTPRDERRKPFRLLVAVRLLLRSHPIGLPRGKLIAGRQGRVHPHVTERLELAGDDECLNLLGETQQANALTEPLL